MSRFTNSSYEGEFLDNWPHGKGRYLFPNGLIYEGEFFKGEFHGKGRLLYENGGYLEGEWENGKLKEKKYYFKDNLEYKENNWDYCTLKDRRFKVEIDDGIKPFDEVILLNSENGIKNIPQGCYGFLTRCRKRIF